MDVIRNLERSQSSYSCFPANSFIIYFAYRLHKFYGLDLTKVINDFIITHIMGPIFKYGRRNIISIVTVKYESPVQNVVILYHPSTQLLPGKRSGP